MAGKEEKTASSQTAEAKTQTGTLKGRSSGFGHGLFGSARFGESSGYEHSKEAKTAGSASLEAKTASGVS